MHISDLNLINAPSCGVMLAYTRESVYLEKYKSIEDIRNKLDDAELLEIHLFDKEREYRAVKSESKRWNPGPKNECGIIQKTVIGDKNDDVYPVEAVLDQSFAKTLKSKSIQILNHIVYDANGVATIDNYRLVEGGM